MGIKGLYGKVLRAKHGEKPFGNTLNTDYMLENAEGVIIDGNALMFHLFESLGAQKKQFYCGGTYSEFYRSVFTFFEGLKKFKDPSGCKLRDEEDSESPKLRYEEDSESPKLRYKEDSEPPKLPSVVVLEGDTKAPRQALKSKTSAKFQYLKKNGSGLLPLWSKCVFVEALTEIGIPVLRGDGAEADTVVVAIARELKWPVLAGDSDFIICNLPEGLVFIQTVDMSEPCKKPCTLFKRSKLITELASMPVFKESKKNLPGYLVIAGALAGNDFCCRDDTGQLYKTDPEDNHAIIWALKWLVGLRHETPLEKFYDLLESEISKHPHFKVQGLLDDEKVKKVMDGIRTTYSTYVPSKDIWKNLQEIYPETLTGTPSHSSERVGGSAPEKGKFCSLMADKYYSGHFGQSPTFYQTESSSPWRAMKLCIEASGYDSYSNFGRPLRQLMDGMLNLRDSSVTEYVGDVKKGEWISSDLAPTREFPGFQDIRDMDEGERTRELQRIRDMDEGERARELQRIRDMDEGERARKLQRIRDMDEGERRHLLLSALRSSTDAVKNLPGPAWRQLIVASLRYMRSLACTSEAGKQPELTDRHLKVLLVGILNGPKEREETYAGVVNVVHIFNAWQNVIMGIRDLHLVLREPFGTLKIHDWYDGVPSCLLYEDEGIEDVLTAAADHSLATDLWKAVEEY